MLVAWKRRPGLGWGSGRVPEKCAGGPPGRILELVPLPEMLPELLDFRHFLAGLWDQGVNPHFCDTREPPPFYGGLAFGNVVSQKLSFSGPFSWQTKKFRDFLECPPSEGRALRVGCTMLRHSNPLQTGIGGGGLFLEFQFPGFMDLPLKQSSVVQCGTLFFLFFLVAAPKGLVVAVLSC